MGSAHVLLRDIPHYPAPLVIAARHPARERAEISLGIRQMSVWTYSWPASNRFEL
jgi:hypothetical protein